MGGSSPPMEETKVSVRRFRSGSFGDSAFNSLVQINFLMVICLLRNSYRGKIIHLPSRFLLTFIPMLVYRSTVPFHWGFVRDGVRGGRERQVLRAALTWCSLSVEVRLTLVT